VKTKYNYKNLIDFINKTKDLYSLEITIKDYVGFISVDENFELAIRPFIAHSSPYCMFVKETESGYESCMKYKDVLYDNCKDGSWYLSRCPLGVEELVMPILLDGKVYGSINVSNFDRDKKLASKTIINFFDNENKGRTVKALETYNNFVKPSSIDLSMILPSLSLLADYISKIISWNTNQASDEIENININQRIKEYTIRNSKNKILANDMIEYLEISKPELQKIIKENGNKNFRELINSIRLEESEKLLLEEDKNPKEIALQLGFKDYHHFAVLFEEKMKISPENYRKYYLHEEHKSIE
jgi:AraC-like DNA-binding protein/putative methionine-R-sulfoxide reductase with GAF domain